jgi:DNA adenine methylase
MGERLRVKPLSPLRYPGGKARLAPVLSNMLADNDLLDCYYVEPFAGGAAVAIELLFSRRARAVWINDFDRSIYAFWHTVLNRTNEIREWIQKVPINIEQWKRQREVQRHKHSADLYALGCSTLYLNRTNVSGVIEGGVIGGLEQKGKWKISARFNRDEISLRIGRIATFRGLIKVTNEDAISLLPTLHGRIPDKSFLYLDPPYYRKGKDLYVNYFTDDMHCELADRICGMRSQNWVVTYDDVPRIRALYPSLRSRAYNINYSAGKASRGAEIMFLGGSIRG